MATASLGVSGTRLTGGTARRATHVLLTGPTRTQLRRALPTANPRPVPRLTGVNPLPTPSGLVANWVHPVRLAWRRAPGQQHGPGDLVDRESAPAKERRELDHAESCDELLDKVCLLFRERLCLKESAKGAAVGTRLVACQVVRGQRVKIRMRRRGRRAEVRVRMVEPRQRHRRPSAPCLPRADHPRSGSAACQGHR